MDIHTIHKTIMISHLHHCKMTAKDNYCGKYPAVGYRQPNGERILDRGERHALLV